MAERSTCLGRYLVIEEPSKEATVYRDGEEMFQKNFDTYTEATDWASNEASLENAEADG